MINKIKHIVHSWFFSGSFTSFIVHLDHIEPLHNCALHLCLLNPPWGSPRGISMSQSLFAIFCLDSWVVTYWHFKAAIWLGFLTAAIKRYIPGRLFVQKFPSHEKSSAKNRMADCFLHASCLSCTTLITALQFLHPTTFSDLEPVHKLLISLKASSIRHKQIEHSTSIHT
jgi:hypothetical protein